MSCSDSEALFKLARQFEGLTGVANWSKVRYHLDSSNSAVHRCILLIPPPPPHLTLFYALLPFLCSDSTTSEMLVLCFVAVRTGRRIILPNIYNDLFPFGSAGRPLHQSGRKGHAALPLLSVVCATRLGRNSERRGGHAALAAAAAGHAQAMSNLALMIRTGRAP